MTTCSVLASGCTILDCAMGRLFWMADCSPFRDLEGFSTCANTLVFTHVFSAASWAPMSTMRFTTTCARSSIPSSLVEACGSRSAKSGRHRSVANAEMWSSIRPSRTGSSQKRLHFICQCDCLQSTCGGACSECRSDRSDIFDAHLHVAARRVDALLSNEWHGH